MTSSPRPALLAAGLVAAGVLALGVAAAPRTPTVAATVSGDAALAETVRPLLENAGVFDNASVVVVDDGEVTAAHFGASSDTEYEIGSISKTFAAALFADAVDRGELAPDDSIGDHLDLDGAPVAGVRLDELAGHTAGLPSVPSGVSQILANYGSIAFGSDPYGYDLAELLDHARSQSLDGRGEYSYSNMGISLLGQAVTVAAGAEVSGGEHAEAYGELVEDRLLAPLGMSATSVPSTADDLAPDAPTGVTAGGRHSDAWTLGSYAPAGSIRSTPADMAAWMTALLDGSAPGEAALEPQSTVDDSLDLGYAWHISDTDAGPVTWHNGRTGGFGSMLALDREGGRAVLVLTDSAVSVDEIGFALLEEDLS